MKIAGEVLNKNLALDVLEVGKASIIGQRFRALGLESRVNR